jgi:hypothetical protein
MARISTEVLTTTPTTVNYLAESAYDYTKWSAGYGIIKNSGAAAVDNYLAPQFSVIRPMETSTPFAVLFTDVISFSPTQDYIFGLENSTTANNVRRVALWTNNKKTGVVAWNGYITLTMSSATAHTARSFKIDYKRETTGTVQVAGTAVTGTSTLFATNRVAVGARIGFGSTDPKLITTWYKIATRTSDTALVLATTAGTIAAGTAYVIEEYRPVVLTTNATTTNGGIHYAKGVSPEDFTSFGTTIAFAAATDDLKAVYWLKDAATQTNIVAAGMDFDLTIATPTSLTVYVSDLVAAGNYKFYTYNIRAALTVATGASVSAWQLATGNNPFTGTGSQNDNMVLATTNHGTGAGVKSLYIVTTTRVYRVPVTQITTTSTTVFSAPSDNITEIPPGGVNTFAATGALSTINYSTSNDGFVIGSTHTGGTYSYVTQYKDSGTQWDKIFGRDQKYIEQSIKDSAHPSLFSNASTVCHYGRSDSANLVYVTKQGTTQVLNQIYIMAWGSDADYANSLNGQVITPEISTPNASKYYRTFANLVRVLGTGALRRPTEPMDIWARTTNIRTDATSGWIAVAEDNDISPIAGASTIQFAARFRTVGETMLPARLLGFDCSYEETTTTDSHYEGSVGETVLASRIFGWRQKTAWGTNIPRMKIQIINVASSTVVLTDDTTTAGSGVWETSADGVTWVAWNAALEGVGRYIRYTATALPDGITARALLTIY